MTQKVHKTLLKGVPEDARVQLDELARRLDTGDFAAGERLRAVAAELVRRGLEVTAVDYQDGSIELEAVLPRARYLGPVTVDRDGSGNGCQLSWEEWVGIADAAGASRAAGMVRALLDGMAGDTA
jgi:hypothetical protein